LTKKIAFFDFDGTITTQDSLLEIIRFKKGTAGLVIGFLLHAPLLIAYKIGIISNHTAKERMLRYFFGGHSADAFQADCNRFANEFLPAFIRPKALHEINRLKELGFTVVVVSASAENWITEWSESLQLPLIATKLEIQNGKITGRLNGRNCYGTEKVQRIKAAFDLSEYGTIHCYGDTKGDKPMLELATFSFYKPFR